MKKYLNSLSSSDNGFEMRFIEYMDIGNNNAWGLERTVTKRDILEILSSKLPVQEVGREKGSTPAL